MQTNRIEQFALSEFQPQYTPYRSYTGDKLLDDIIDCSQHGEPVKLNSALVAHMIRDKVISVKQNSKNSPNQSIDDYIWLARKRKVEDVILDRQNKAITIIFEEENGDDYNDKNEIKIEQPTSAESWYIAVTDGDGICWASYYILLQTCHSLFYISVPHSKLASVPDFPNIWVSEKYGQVFKVDSSNIKNCLPLAQNLLGTKESGGKYLCISIAGADGKTINPRVHRLVCYAWHHNPYCYSQVNHIDENRFNNDADNLEFCTPEYNLKYYQVCKAIKNAPQLFAYKEDYPLIRDTVNKIIYTNCRNKQEQKQLEQKYIQELIDTISKKYDGELLSADTFTF